MDHWRQSVTGHSLRVSDTHPERIFSSGRQSHSESVLLSFDLNGCGEPALERYRGAVVRRRCFEAGPPTSRSEEWPLPPRVAEAMEWLPEVTSYIEVLAASADATTRAEDRPRYEAHLAAAARLFALLAAQDTRAVAAWFRSEEHSYGWQYLSGDCGNATHGAFVELTRALHPNAL